MNQPLLNKLQKYYKNNALKKLSKEELIEVLDYLAVEDEKFRLFIGELIVYQDERSFPVLFEGLKKDDKLIRRSVFFIMNKLIKKGVNFSEDEVLGVAHRHLIDHDPKVRKNSAILLGNVESSQSTSHLISALDNEEIFWVRSSIILALGAIDDDEVKMFFSEYQSKGEAEEAALHKVIDKLMLTRNKLDFADQLNHEIPIELWTAPGLEATLAKDLSQQLDLSVERLKNGVLTTRVTDFKKLLSIRTFNECLIRFGSIRYENIDHIPSKVMSLFSEVNLNNLMSLYQENPTNLRYRIEVRGKNIKHYQRKAIIKEIMGKMKDQHSNFVNSPSTYDIEMRIVVERNELRLLWKPTVEFDTRFNYRLGDVPASINPSVAAGLLKLSTSEATSKHRILDPFCGSGTMLIERAIKGDFKEIVGVDLSKQAIDVANENIKAANIDDFKLVHSDILSFTDQHKFNELVTNMPFGLRVGSHENNLKLYTDFFTMLPDLLEENASILLYTLEIDLTEKLFKQNKHLELERVIRVQSGGLNPAVFIGKRV